MCSKKVNIIYKNFENTAYRAYDLEKLFTRKGYEVISDETKEVDILFYSDYEKLEIFSFKKRIRKHKNTIKFFVSGENIEGFRESFPILCFTMLYKTLDLKFFLFRMSFFSKLFFSLDFLHRIETNRYRFLLPFEKNTFFDVPYKRENNLGNPYFFCHGHQDISALKKRKKINIVPKKFCFFAVSNPSSIDRIKFFLKLSKYKTVDSFGLILNNTGNLNDRFSMHENYKRIRDYKFALCFENSYDENYITEKIIQAMRGDAIPVYRGAPNVGEYFNTKSFINYEDHDCSYDKMIEKVIELDQDDEKYLKMLNEPFLIDNKLPKSYLNKEKKGKVFYNRVYEAFEEKKLAEAQKRGFKA